MAECRAKIDNVTELIAKMPPPQPATTLGPVTAAYQFKPARAAMLRFSRGKPKATQTATSSSENSTDIGYRPSQSTVDTNRPQRPLLGRCPYSQRLRLSPQMISRTCGIHMGPPLELKRRKAGLFRGLSFMLTLSRALLLLIHLSLPKFNVLRPFRSQRPERCRPKPRRKVPG